MTTPAEVHASIPRPSADVVRGSAVLPIPTLGPGMVQACVPASQNHMDDIRVATIKAQAALVEQRSTQVKSTVTIRSTKAGGGAAPAPSSSRFEEHIAERATGTVADTVVERVETPQLSGRAYVCVIIRAN